MATTIITLTSGSYSYENGTIKVSGGLNIDGETIMRIDGIVLNNAIQIGSYNANRDEPMSQGQLRFNISFTDPSAGTVLLQAVQDAVTAVQNKLQEG